MAVRCSGPPLKTSNSNSEDDCELRLSDDILKSLRTLRMSGQLCDFTLVVEEQCYSIHKIIFAAQSEVFKSMFNENFIEGNTNIATLQDLTKETFEILSDFLYGDDKIFDSYTTEELLKVIEKADMYFIDILKTHCVQFIKNFKKNGQLSKCYAFASKMNREIEVKAILEEVSLAFTRAHSEYSLDFEEMTIDLIKNALRHFCENEESKLKLCVLTADSVRRRMNFIIKWASKHRDVGIDELSTLFKLSHINLLPIKSHQTFLKDRSCYLNRKNYDDLESFSCKINRSVGNAIKDLSEEIQKLRLRLIFVETCGDTIVTIKEFLFEDNSYKCTTFLIGFKVTQFCSNNENETYLVGDRCFVIFNHENRQFSETIFFPISMETTRCYSAEFLVNELYIFNLNETSEDHVLLVWNSKTGNWSLIQGHFDSSCVQRTLIYKNDIYVCLDNYICKVKKAAEFERSDIAFFQKMGVANKNSNIMPVLEYEISFRNTYLEHELIETSELHENYPLHFFGSYTNETGTVFVAHPYKDYPEYLQLFTNFNKSESFHSLGFVHRNSNNFNKFIGAMFSPVKINQV